MKGGYLGFVCDGAGAFRELFMCRESNWQPSGHWVSLSGQ
jgi:hypothetical protein